MIVILTTRICLIKVRDSGRKGMEFEMKARYIKAISLGLAGVLLISVVAMGHDSEVIVTAKDTTNIRAGICSESNTESMIVDETTGVTAGVTLEMGDVVVEATAMASVSDMSLRTTATAEDTSCYGYTNLGIAVVEEGNLNVREEATTDSKMVGKMPRNSACEILETLDGWYKIQSGEVSGYVSAEFIVTGDEARAIADTLVSTVAKSTTSTLNVRVEPNTECSIVTTMAEGEELEVVELLDGWVKVNVDSDEGYVSADYVTVSTELPHAMTMTEARYGVGVSDVRVALVDYACQFVGNPYVWGGTSLTKGADCSGFVLSVFANYGYSLPHSSKAQANSGTKISASEAKPGDLFFYGNGSGINHVAIYIGGGQVVHASSPKTGIRISNSNYRTPVKVVRIIND